MVPRAEEEDWDLRPVIDLIYSLSVYKDPYTKAAAPKSPSSPSQERRHTPLTFQNGSEQASQLGNFDKIWQYLDQPTDLLPPEVPVAPLDGYIEVLDDDGHGHHSPLKAVKWRDELEGADLADNDENYDLHGLGNLTKSQRKKARRKQRRDAEACRDGRTLPSESEDDSGKEAQAAQIPDRKTIIHEILHGNSLPDHHLGRLRSGKVLREGVPPDAAAWPVASPYSARQAIQILTPPKDKALTVAAAKTTKLISMLTETFIDERQYLSNISLVRHLGISASIPAEGLHVFVDASNIMIGFHDALKLSRGQSIHQRIRRQPLSFHNLSLILERGRPTAKRVVVGSDNFPAITEAKAIGYETNILDRVHKAKELTPRQKRFTNSETGTGTGSGSETTAATAAAATVQYAPEKWVEQAVDEILHLKMMESIVDAREASTMVLATGDAAEAEYSGGFLKMVERALGKGWKVELASFKHNMSGAYKRKEFRQKWGDKFRVVELDDFVEVLLGSE